MRSPPGQHRIAAAVAAALLWPLAAPAQVTLDGTLGAGGALAGPNYSITAGMGRTVGANLFHSFGQFNVLTGQSATFSGPGSIHNIIGRVTGGTASTIDGTLRSTINGANLWLINPAGMMFGPNAALDLTGSFHASTAHYLKLGSSGRFDAANPAASVLVSAPPSAFGFLGPTGGITTDNSTLTVAPGKTLSLVGGDVYTWNTLLGASGGRINVAGMASAGEITPSASGLATTAGATLANIVLEQSSVLADSDAGLAAGRIVIRGGHLLLDRALVRSENLAGTAGRGIAVEADGDLLARNSIVASFASGDGDGGDLTVRARNIAVLEGATFSTSTFAAGRGGAFDIRASESLTISGNNGAGTISALLGSAWSSGAAGDMTIAAPSVVISNGNVQSNAHSTGAGGRITVRARDISLLQGGLITTEAYDAGDGGLVTLDASQSVTIAGRQPGNGPWSTLNSRAYGAGDASGVRVSAPLVALYGGIIVSDTDAGGAAGSVRVDAERIDILGGGRISTDTRGAGAGGSIVLNAGESVRVSGTDADGFFSSLYSSMYTGADAGNITITAPRFTVNGGNVYSETHGAGAGGRVAVKADGVSLVGGARISTDSRGAGDGGTISIDARGTVNIAGRDAGDFNSTLSSNAYAGGDAGGIDIRAGALVLADGRLLSESSGAGAGGNVSVYAGSIDLVDGGRISTNTEGPGRGGSISLAARDYVNIAGTNVDGVYSSLYSSAFDRGRAGSIAISAPLLAVTRGNIYSQSNDTGAGGNVTVDAARVVLTEGARISTDANGVARGGSITVNASEYVLLTGRDVDGFIASFYSNANAAGDAGGITITTPVLQLRDGTIISESKAGGAGGSVTVNAARVDVLDGSRISTDASGAATGGSIAINATEAVSIGGRNAGGGFSSLNSSSSAGGDAGGIRIATGALAMDDSGIYSEGSGTGAAGNVAIAARQVSLTGGSVISVDTTGPGRGGSLHIAATESVAIAGADAAGNRSKLSSRSLSTGAAGNITVDTGDFVMTGTSITSDASGDGDAGSVTVNAARVSLLDGAQISTDTSGAGRGGAITLNAAGPVTITGRDANGFFSSLFTNAYGAGDAGGIRIKATDFTIHDATMYSDGYGTGAAGNVTVEGARVAVSGGSLVSTATWGPGRGGTISIDATESVFIGGQDAAGFRSSLRSTADAGGDAGGVFVSAPGVSIDGGIVTTSSYGSGRGGTITIRGGDVSVLNGGSIAATTFGAGQGGVIDLAATQSISLLGPETDFGGSGIFNQAQSTGDAGTITVSAPLLRLDGAFISAETVSSGRAGDVDIAAGRVEILNGGLIGASSFGAGRGGAVRIQATESVVLAGVSPYRYSGITTSARSSGAAGSIHVGTPSLYMDSSVISTGSTDIGAGGDLSIQAGRIVLVNGAFISASSSGLGNTGAITLNATESLRLGGGSFISTEALLSDGGNITITARDLVYLKDSSITTSVQGGAGNGGNILIDPIFVVLDNSQIIANAFGGNGGNIDIVSQFFLKDDESLVQASSKFGLSGIINVTAPQVDLGASLVALPSSFFDASLLMRESCAARAGRAENSFKGAGRGGLPDSPDAMGYGSYEAALSGGPAAYRDTSLALAQFSACN